MKNFTTFSVAMLCAYCVHAQVDPHFSQYYAYPVYLNPALTGVVDGDYRVTANYRNQWSQVMNAYNTLGVSADFATAKTINLGVNMLRQSAGNGGYRYTTAYATAAYTGIRFGAEGYRRIVFAMQAGMVHRRFDPSKISFGDQYNPVTGYNPSNPTSEMVNRYSSTKLDIGAGILYYDGEPDKRVNVFGGVSAFHLNRPEDRFFTGSDEKLPMRFNVHAGARINVSPGLFFTPNLLYMKQGNQEEKVLGAYAQIETGSGTGLLAGGYYRWNDAVLAFAGVHLSNMVVGLSYDVNASGLKSLSRSPNAFELSVSFIGRKERPFAQEYFICPRL